MGEPDKPRIQRVDELITSLAKELVGGLEEHKRTPANRLRVRTLLGHAYSKIEENFSDTTCDVDELVHAMIVSSLKPDRER